MAVWLPKSPAGPTHPAQQRPKQFLATGNSTFGSKGEHREFEVSPYISDRYKIIAFRTCPLQGREEEKVEM
jgi:hypothetical protein